MASVDGGQTWTVVDTITDTTASWQERTVSLDKLTVKDTLQVRWTANNPVATDQVEAGIDDFQVMSLTQACNPNANMPPAGPPATMPMGGGCGCQLGAAPTGGTAALVVLLLLGGLLVRRRYN